MCSRHNERRGQVCDQNRAYHMTPWQTYHDDPIITLEALIRMAPGLLAAGAAYTAFIAACCILHFAVLGHWPAGW